MKKRIITGLALIMAVLNVFAWSHDSKSGSGVSMATVGILATLKKADGSEFGESDKELLTAIDKLITAAVQNKTSKEDIEKQLKELEERFPNTIKQETIDNINETLKNQASLLDALKEAGKGLNKNAKETAMSLISKELMSKENQEKLQAMRVDRKGSFKVIVKAPLNDGADDLQQTSYMPGINYAPQERNRISDHVNIIVDNRPNSTYTYSEEYDPTGSIAVVDCGALKPLVGAKYRQVTANPEKFAGHIKECDDLLLYVPALLGQMQNLLMRKLEDARDAAIVSMLDADGAVFNLTGASTTNPNDRDALRYSIAQCRTLNHYPTHVFLNPVDAANMDCVKGEDGHYLFITNGAPGMPPTVSAIAVYETNQIPQGSFCVGDMTRVNLRYLTDIIFRVHYGVTIDGSDVTDDNTHDIITIVCEQFVNKFIKTLDSGAFVYDTFANVKGAL